MKPKPIPPVVRSCLSYDKKSGILIWNFRPRSDFNSDRSWNTFNTRFANKVAGTLTKDGYVNVIVNGTSYRAHRIIVYLMTYKRWTDKNGVEWESWEEWKEVDHRNCTKCDNRWKNLQPSDTANNGWNKSKHIDNTSGLKNVTWHKRSEKWAAQMRVNGRQYNLGLFDDKWEAHFHVCFWSHVLHGKFARE